MKHTVHRTSHCPPYFFKVKLLSCFKLWKAEKIIIPLQSDYSANLRGKREKKEAEKRFWSFCIKSKQTKVYFN